VGVDFTIPNAGSRDDVLYRWGSAPVAVHRSRLWVSGSSTTLAKLRSQLDAALTSGSGLLNPAVLAFGREELLSVLNARLLRAWPGFTGEYADAQSFSASAVTRPRRQPR
jgi:hypothetical protein